MEGIFRQLETQHTVAFLGGRTFSTIEVRLPLPLTGKRKQAPRSQRKLHLLGYKESLGGLHGGRGTGGCVVRGT